jgi:hypothetical protein
MALIEARGAVVGKDALMARVWPDRIVEENSLQAQIMALRAAFGAERGLIRTVSGRGYQLTGGPCPPATAFDFPSRLARGRAHALTEGKCWRFYVQSARGYSKRSPAHAARLLRRQLRFSLIEHAAKRPDLGG